MSGQESNFPANPSAAAGCELALVPISSDGTQVPGAATGDAPRWIETAFAGSAAHRGKGRWNRRGRRRIAVALAGGAVGYALAIAGQPGSPPRQPKPESPVAQPRASQTASVRPSSPGPGHRRPSLPFREYLMLSGRRHPLFGPENSQAGLSSDWIYAYPAPIRVISEKCDVASRLEIALGFTVPEAVLAEAKDRIEAKAKAHVTLVPIAFRWYEMAIRDPGSGQEHTWREDAGNNPNSLILAPDRKVMTWDVPAQLDVLRRLLKENPQSVTVRIRAAYDFQAIASGVVRTGVVGSIDRTIDEIVRPNGEGRAAHDEFLVSRGVHDQLRSALTQNVVHYLENAGLGAEEWASVSDQLARLVTGYFDRLQVANLAEILDATDDQFVWLYGPHGHAEARPLMRKNKILQSEHEAEYHKKARDIIETIQDVARDNKDARKFHSEIHQRFKGDLETAVDVIGIFGAKGNLRLDRDEHNLSTSDVEQIARSRDFYLGDHAWEEEISSKAKSKVQGELIDERAWAKTIEVVRFDRRELTQRVGAIGEYIKSLGFEEVVLQDEVPLIPSPDRGAIAYVSLKQALKETEGKLYAKEDEVKHLRSEQDSRRKKAAPLYARRREIDSEIRLKETELGALVAAPANLARSIEGDLARIVKACTNAGLYGKIGAPAFWRGMLETYNHHHQVGWHIDDKGGHENSVSNTLAIETANEAVAVAQRDEAVNGGKAAIQSALNSIATNAARIDEVRKIVASKRAEVAEIDSRIRNLLLD